VDLPGAAALGGDPAGDLPQRHRLALARTLADGQGHRGVGELVLMSPSPVIGAGDGRERVRGQVRGRAFTPGEQAEPGRGDVREQAGRRPVTPRKTRKTQE
jgi:hypothetical protein